jgi:hypothetical protein
MDQSTIQMGIECTLGLISLTHPIPLVLWKYKINAAY